MNVILAVAEKSIERYVGTFPDINILKTLNNNRTLYNDVVDMNPHLLLVSNSLAGKERVDEILQRLRKEQPQTRIAYLYGADDIIRPAFTNMLIEIGVYDFHVGEVDEEIIKELLFNPKTKNNVQVEMISEPEQKAIDEQLSKMQKQRTELRDKPEKKYKKVKQKADISKVSASEAITTNEQTPELPHKQKALPSIKSVHPQCKKMKQPSVNQNAVPTTSSSDNTVDSDAATVESSNLSDNQPFLYQNNHVSEQPKNIDRLPVTPWPGQPVAKERPNSPMSKNTEPYYIHTNNFAATQNNNVAEQPNCIDRLPVTPWPGRSAFKEG